MKAFFFLIIFFLSVLMLHLHVHGGSLLLQSDALWLRCNPWLKNKYRASEHLAGESIVQYVPHKERSMLLPAQCLQNTALPVRCTLMCK